MATKRSKDILSTRKIEMYNDNAKTIKYLRRNPVIACETLLGIKLMDSQKYILEQSWNTPHIVWCCSRNFGKSFLGAILMILKAILYENQAIYIISSVGSQAQETFTKIEEICLRMGKTSNSIASLKDIVANETVKSPACKTGFSHSQTGFHVEFYNGSEIFTLNGNPDNNRSKRATMVFFDEAGFSSDELIAVSEAFATQDLNFITSIDEDFNLKVLRKKCPTQLVYASSASDVDTIFYRKYKDFAKKMFLGDKRYFCCDIPCEIPLHPLMDGKIYPALLQQSKVDNAMSANREKALREYFNKFTTDGGENQIVKWGQVRRNETFILPELHFTEGGKYALAFDPARSGDNSIVTVMKIIEDENIGYYGEIVNCTNLVDLASKKGIKMASPDQIKSLKDYILAYNGNFPDYENIEVLQIDAGAGGGGVSAYSDNLLEDWTDSKGIGHKGFLDQSYELYAGYSSKYPNASNKINLLSPNKYRTQMCDEFVELMQLDLIKFPKEYDGKGYVTLQKPDGEEIKLVTKSLTMEEEIALMNIDVLKNEITSIYKFENPEKTSKSYRMSKEKEGKVHDDRFYTIIMLSHFLYDLRRKNIVNKNNGSTDLSSYFVSTANMNQANNAFNKNSNRNSPFGRRR